MRWVGPILCLTLLCGCSEVLQPGQWGEFRYFGEVPGTTPLRLHPPISDRDGNVYVLFGDRDIAESVIYVGHPLGGWSGGCEAHKGTFGVHGLLGRSADRAWYWSGDALVKVDGATGMCGQILDEDPTTNTELQFRAVVPWVLETPTQTSMLAMIQGATDPLPYHVVIDLDLDLYYNLYRFEPDGAQDVVVLGTGAHPANRRGYIVVQYPEGNGHRHEALVLDDGGAIVERATLDVAEELAPYAIQGFLQASDAGLVAGVLDDGRLLVFTESGGGTKSVGDMTPAGVVARDGVLWVTGTADGAPVVARLEDSGDLGGAERFRTAEEADGALGGGIDVLDERSDPSHYRDWDDARTAMSTHPLVSPYPLDVYTTGSTGWLVAGPGYDTGVEGMTAVAYAPVGLEFP